MANISVTLYDGAFDVAFDCCGPTKCKFALCEFMPPENDDANCMHKIYGSCHSSDAQIAAMESVKRRLSGLIKSTGDSND